MAGSRTLKLSILADVDDLKKKLGQGENEVKGFGDKVSEFGQKAKAAFAVAAAAAAAYAGKLLVDGVKAAIEDAAAQERLRTSLQNVVGASDEAVKATEQYIENMSLAYGVADDQLRPAYQRLAIATGSLQQANTGLSLAMNIAAGTGKSVETVANALAKAYEGNLSALGRLGVGMSAAEMKTLGLEGTLEKLSETFRDQASIQANTFQGQMARLQVRMDETKESIGMALLPVLERLLRFFNENIGPAVEAIRKKFEPFTNAIKENKDELNSLWSFLSKYVVPILTGALKLSINGIVSSITLMVNVISKVVSAFQSMYEKYKQFVDFIKNNPLSKFLGNLNPFGNASFQQAGFATGTAGFTFEQAGSSGTVSARGTNESIPEFPTFLVPGGKYSYKFLREMGFNDDTITAWKNAGLIITTTPEGYTREEVLSYGGTEASPIEGFLAARAAGRLAAPQFANEINITVQGALDPEAVSRQIVDILNQASARGTLGSSAFSGTF